MDPLRDTPCCQDPFETALQALVNDEATPKDLAILNDALRVDPEARRIYREAIAFEAMLAREFPRIEESQASPGTGAGPGRHRFRSIALAAAVAATATLAALWLPRDPSPPAPLAAEPDPDPSDFTHAVVSSLDEATGRFGQAPLQQGLRLAEGTLELDQGFAEITFDTGAEVTLEGPARLQLESDHRARLAKGRAAARVPEQARGFVIHTPSSFIRDQGTTYAVEVRDDRETDLHVLEGQVEVAATSRHSKPRSKILRQREAVRFASGSILPISFRPDNPAEKRKTRTPKVPPHVHWSFDSWTAHTTIDSHRGHTLKLLQPKGPATPQLIDGPFGQALRLDGSGTFARSDYPGVPGSQARTVACWIRLDPASAAAPSTPNAFLAWGSNKTAAKWQIAWNKTPAQGSPGAPRVEFGDGFATGSTDLRDGQWHHLAVVFLGGPKANVASHVRIYLDGKLEPLTGRRQRKIDSANSAAEARPLTLGRVPGNQPAANSRGFDGDLDEIHVFEGPLLPGQIVRLMKLNQLKQQGL